MTKKLIAIMAAVACAALLFAGCAASKPSQDESESTQETTATETTATETIPETTTAAETEPETTAAETLPETTEAAVTEPEVPTAAVTEPETTPAVSDGLVPFRADSLRWWPVGSYSEIKPLEYAVFHNMSEMKESAWWQDLYSQDRSDMELPDFEAKYNESWFETNSLVLVMKVDSSITREYSVREVVRNGSALEVTLRREGGKNGVSDMMEDWRFLIEIEKAYMDQVETIAINVVKE